MKPNYLKRTKEECMNALNVLMDEFKDDTKHQDELQILKDLIQDVYEQEENDHDFDWYKHEYFAMCDLFEEKDLLDEIPKKIFVMCHALGIKTRNFKKGQSRYACTRNAFAVSEPDKRWEDLVRIGYAKSKEDQGKIVYSLTSKGRIFLGKIYDKNFILE